LINYTSLYIQVRPDFEVLAPQTARVYLNYSVHVQNKCTQARRGCHFIIVYSISVCVMQVFCFSSKVYFYIKTEQTRTLFS